MGTQGLYILYSDGNSGNIRSDGNSGTIYSDGNSETIVIGTQGLYIRIERQERYILYVYIHRDVNSGTLH